MSALPPIRGYILTAGHKREDHMDCHTAQSGDVSKRSAFRAFILKGLDFFISRGLRSKPPNAERTMPTIVATFRLGCLRGARSQGNAVTIC